jgi:hypothetical protein
MGWGRRLHLARISTHIAVNDAATSVGMAGAVFAEMLSTLEALECAPTDPRQRRWAILICEGFGLKAADVDVDADAWR